MKSYESCFVSVSLTAFVALRRRMQATMYMSPINTAIPPNAAMLTPTACALVRLVECEDFAEATPVAVLLGTAVGEGWAAMLLERVDTTTLVAAIVIGDDDIELL